jgi:hypothetical protein
MQPEYRINARSNNMEFLNHATFDAFKHFFTQRNCICSNEANICWLLE